MLSADFYVHQGVLRLWKKRDSGSRRWSATPLDLVAARRWGVSWPMLSVEMEQLFSTHFTPTKRPLVTIQVVYRFSLMVESCVCGNEQNRQDQRSGESDVLLIERLGHTI
jgi:hypothetical protein